MAAGQSTIEWLPYFTLIVPLLSAFRLAKFNVDTRQSDQFIGLPTPANALLISTLPYLASAIPEIGTWLSEAFVLVGIAWIMAILLVMEIPLIALKFKNFSFASNVFRYVLLGIGCFLVLYFGFAGIPWVILSYIALSLIENGSKRQ